MQTISHYILANIYPCIATDLCLRLHLLSGKVAQRFYCSKISPLISHYVKHTLTIRPNNSTPKYLPKYMEAHATKVICT